LVDVSPFAHRDSGCYRYLNDKAIYASGLVAFGLSSPIIISSTDNSQIS